MGAKKTTKKTRLKASQRAGLGRVAFSSLKKNNNGKSLRGKKKRVRHFASQWLGKSIINKAGTFAVVFVLLVASLFAKAEPTPPLIHDIIYPQSCRGTWQGMNNIFIQDLDTEAVKEKFNSKNSATPALGELSIAATEGKEKYNAFTVSLPVLDQNNVTPPNNATNAPSDTNNVTPSNDLELIIPDAATVTPLNGTNDINTPSDTNSVPSGTSDNSESGQQREQEGSSGERVLGADDVTTVTPLNDTNNTPTETAPEPEPPTSPAEPSAPSAETPSEQPVIINLLDSLFNRVLAEDAVSNETTNELAPVVDNLNPQDEPGDAGLDSANPSLLDNIAVVIEKIGEQISDTFAAISSPLESVVTGNNNNIEESTEPEVTAQSTEEAGQSLVQKIIETIADTLSAVTDFIIPLPFVSTNQSSLTSIPDDLAAMENGTIACADFSPESTVNIQRVALGLSMNSSAGEGLLMAEYTSDRQNWYSLGAVDLNPPLVSNEPQYQYVNFPADFDAVNIGQTIVRLRWYGNFKSEAPEIYLDSFWLDVSSIDDGQETPPELKVAKKDFAAFEEPIFDLSIDPSTAASAANSEAVNNVMPNLDQSIIERYKEKYRELIQSWTQSLAPDRQSLSLDYGTGWGGGIGLGSGIGLDGVLGSGRGVVARHGLESGLGYGVSMALGQQNAVLKSGLLDWVRAGDWGVGDLVGLWGPREARAREWLTTLIQKSQSNSPDYWTGRGWWGAQEARAEEATAQNSVLKSGLLDWVGGWWGGEALAQGLAADGGGERGVKTWREHNLEITARLLTKDKKPTDIIPELQKLNSGKYKISLASRSFSPGAYILETTIQKGGTTQTLEQDFSWGVLVINTDQSVYKTGDTAELYFGVLDNNGNTVCDATLEAKITDSAGQTIAFTTADSTIKPSGFCSKNSVTDAPDYKAAYQTTTAGTYNLTVTATTADGSHTITDYFTVQDDLPYRVRRLGASRIYPLAKYAMTIEVTAAEGFNGMVKETLPVEFAITPSSVFTHAPVPLGGTVRGSATRNPVRQEATAVKPWSFTCPPWAEEYKNYF